MFNILLLNLVPANAQNRTSKKITSESAVIKKKNQTTPTKKNIYSSGKTYIKSVSLSNISQTKSTSITFV